MPKCKSIGCKADVVPEVDFCSECAALIGGDFTSQSEEAVQLTMAERYPKYYKSVRHLAEIDVYAVHLLFNVQDPSGALQHASKKLLLSGVRTGGKSAYDDVREARDTLTRWLELNA